MSRGRKYTLHQREKAIRQKRKMAFDLFNLDIYPHLGCYDKGKIRIWRCARDRYERLPDKRKLIAMEIMSNQIFELENNETQKEIKTNEKLILS